MARKSPESQLKAKQKRQKTMAAVGGVLLLSLLAIQGPSMLKKLNAKPAPLPGNVLPPNGLPPGQTLGAPTLAAPTLSGGNTTAGSSGGSSPAGGNGRSAALAVFEITPTPAQGQLQSFSRFVAKDPFQQQISVDENGIPIGQVTETGDGGHGDQGAEPGSTAGGSSGTGGNVPVTPVSSVSISVNGAPEASVGVGADFPVDNPVFHLLSATTVSAKITIAGGSYADGRATVTLRPGKAVTLQNTADGTVYKLLLVRSG